MQSSTSRLLRRLHRRIGIFLALFLILLAVTGVTLNHSEDFNLNKHYLPGFLAAQILPSHVINGYRIDGRYFYVSDEWLSLEGKALTYCHELKGAIELEEEIALACDSDLILLTRDYHLIERLGVADGVPETIQALGRTSLELALLLDAGWFRFDESTARILPLTTTETVVVNETVDIPSSLTLGQAVSWQQFILDLHSGSLFGIGGRLFNDLLAAMVIIMSLSGIVLWWKLQPTVTTESRRTKNRIKKRG